LLPGVPFDTLDFTSFTLNLGSKVVLDATRGTEAPASPPTMPVTEAQVKALHPAIRRARLVEETLLAVQVAGEGRPVIETLVKAPSLAGCPVIVAVSEDVRLDDQESLLWGIFTRFDPARDIRFTEAQLHGAWPVCRGRMGIDATFKTGYPASVVMSPEVVRRVDERWKQYWRA
jgi:4-hydroxy-3-polyprenylbenzoate decarboxylase